MFSNTRRAMLAGSAFAALLPLSAASAQMIQVGGVGWEGQGADLVVLNLDPGGPDMILMAYDNPAGGNSFRYRVGRNLNANGVATGGWLPMVQVPGLGWEGQGAAAAVGRINANPRPDLVFVAYDAPPQANNFRYTIGWDLNAAGVATSWTTVPQVNGLGWEGQGAGAALLNLDGNPRPELVLMAYDNPAQGNNFRYTIGWNLNPATGIATNWTTAPQLPGFGWEGQGAGLAIACLDADQRGDWIFMAYDNPAGANNFRYQVMRNFFPTPIC